MRSVRFELLLVSLSSFSNQKSVRVLVNNVGLSYNFPEYLHLVEDKTLDDLVSVS